jgi:hypothetical protein
MSQKTQNHEEQAFQIPTIDPSTPLHKLRQRRHDDGRDLKVVVTQRNSETGGGKTTLAVWLALCWDQEWDGKEQGTVAVQEFLNTYPDLPRHSVLIMDEAEELDARRSMKSENIEFSKHWMTMRTRQIDSILTLPTASALDKRLLELADVRINVVSRGLANCYRVRVDDHHPEQGPQEWFMHELEWPDISEHPEFQKLDDQKQALIDGEIDGTTGRPDDEENGEDTASRKRQIREEAKRRRKQGESIRDIRKHIPNNPDTSAPYSKDAVHRWVQDVDSKPPNAERD